MRMVVGGWARMVASKHCTTYQAIHPTPRNTEIQHPTSILCTVPSVAVPVRQNCTLTTSLPVYQVYLSKWLHQCRWMGSRKLTRCFHSEPKFNKCPFKCCKSCFKFSLDRRPTPLNSIIGLGYQVQDERDLDQITPSMGEQPSSPSSSCASSIVADVVKHWTQSLDIANVPEAHLSAEHIVAHILGVTRGELLSHSTAATTLSKQQLVEVDRLMTCRLARMPLQYILGEWDFHNITLKMVPPVFIPRPETEQLVELTIDSLRDLESPRVLEIGCGSGAISLALLHALPQVQCVAVDQSKHAVELTKANASQLRLSERLTVVMGKVTTSERPPLPNSNYDLIVSNPPYVLRKDLMEVQPEIMMYEDLRALDGGKDGLEVVKAVLQHAHHLLQPGRTLFLEVDPCHPYLLPAWLKKQKLNLKLVQVLPDFNKKERFMEFIKTH